MKETAASNFLLSGNGHRTQHATDANKESSRSHAVMQVFIKIKEKDAGLSTEVKVAKMSLIDLAGSEKVRRLFSRLLLVVIILLFREPSPGTRERGSGRDQTSTSRCSL